MRLTALAERAGATYSRYADDLAFSGDAEFAAQCRRFQDLVAVIALEEGFEVNTRKTRAMPRGRRQRVTGLVVNEHPNVSRAEHDRLKAILHNGARFGLASQNRDGVADFEAHLRGRISWFVHVHPARGRRLLEQYGRIVSPPD